MTAAAVSGPRGDALAAALAGIGFSGVALAAGPDGVLAEIAMGEADRANARPNTPATRFGIASVSKMLTAAALVRLFERGAAAPGTPAVDVLPPPLRPGTLDRGVTLEHLLTHASGIADYVDEAGGEAYESLWTRWNPAVMRRPADLLPLFADLPPRAPPGTEVRYNNAGFVLLGLALEALTGAPFADAIRDEVLVPASMADTGYPALDDVVPRLALGHLPPEHPGGPWRTNVYAIPAGGQPDGGAFATAADLVRFLDALADGRLIGPGWLEAMLRPRTWDPAEGCHYGLGVWRSGEGRLAHVGHPGGDPGFSARVAWYPASGIRLVVLSNVTAGAGPAWRLLEGALLR